MMNDIKVIGLMLMMVTIAATKPSLGAVPGAYVGLGGGWSELGTPNKAIYLPGEGTDHTNSDSKVIINNKTYRNGMISGFIYTGYNFSPYLGAEISYNHYTYSTYETTQTNIDIPNPENNSTVNADITFKTHTYNIVGIAYLPVTEAFDLYARGGIAYVYQNVYHMYHRGNPDSPFHAILDETQMAHPYDGNNVTTGFRPTAGIGLNLMLDEHWSFGLAYDHTFGVGNLANSRDAIASLDMSTMNLTYSF